MTESHEGGAPKETGGYQPQEVHRSWLQKTNKILNAAIEVARPAAFYAGSALATFHSGVMQEKANVSSYIESFKSITEQIGTSVSPETIQEVMNLANSNEAASVVMLTGAGVLFMAGTASVVGTTIKAYEK